MISKFWCRFRSGCPPYSLAALFLSWVLLIPGSVPGLAQQQPEESKPGLRIDDVQFEDEHGDIRYSLITQPGTQVVMSFRVQGFERQEIEKQDEVPEDHVHLQYDAELRDPQGVLVAPAESGEIDTMLGPRDDDWTPRIRWSAALPKYALMGEYKIGLRVRDVLSGDETTGSVPVRVRGELIPANVPLGVRQLEYANTKNGPWFPRRVFALRRPVNVRFKVAGFAVSPDSEVWVEQDWAVIDAEGNVLISQQNAVVEHETLFYPPRYFQTILELMLEDPKPGPYTFRITIRDRISGESASSDSEFTLRP